MASFEDDIRCWESVDVEGDFQADTALFRDATCDDLLEYDETFKPLWQADARSIACFDPTTDADGRHRSLGSSQENKSEEAETASSSPRSGAISPNTRKRWTTEEERQLLECMKEHGNRWSKIAAIIKTKNTVQIKTHAHYLLKKNCSRSQSSEGDKSLGSPETSKGTAKTAKRHSSGKTKGSAGTEGHNVIVLKEAEAIETIKNKFPDSEIVSIDKSADEDDDIDVDVDLNVDEDPDTRCADGVAAEDNSKGRIIEDAQLEGSLQFGDTDMAEATVIPPQDGDQEMSKPDDLTPAQAQEQRPDRIMLDTPTSELSLDENLISEEEKNVHAEFFTGNSQQKTPERYLKIRNFILETWANQKPNYLNKTVVRQGLKNCGDVNCIGRIHDYLEQIGAINFGCPGVTYQKKKPQAQSKKAPAKKKSFKTFAERPQRKKAANIGDMLKIDVKGGGVTVEHGSGGGVISQTLIRSRAKPSKPRQNPFKLVTCRNYDNDQEPFSIHVSVTALLEMDIHAHLLETEVIGLLGGYYDDHKSRLVVSAVEPCDSVSTGLECEMDSVSQTMAMESLLGRGCDVVGWYHSHPTFVPNPSVRDLTTQRDYQGLFSSQGRPFVAAILSPYLPLNPTAPQATIAKSLVTKTKWWVVRGGSSENPRVSSGCPSTSLAPYGFNTKLLKTDTSCLPELSSTINGLVVRISSISARIKLSKPYPYLPSLHYLDKMLTSLQFHLTNSDTTVEDAAEILQAVHAAFTEC